MLPAAFLLVLLGAPHARAQCLNPRLVAGNVACSVGEVCQVPLTLDAAPLSVASASGELAVGTALSCAPAPDNCVVGPSASLNSACFSNASADGTTCSFFVGDLATLAPLSDGEVVSIGVRCESAGSFPIAFDNGVVSLSEASTTLPIDGACGEPGVVTCEATSGCGDGIVSAGEACDDGNTLDGDCCSSTCQFETGTCDDGDLCTTGDQCVGASCQGLALDCSALNSDCTLGSCDANSGECVALPANEGAACDDGAFCTTGETCAGGSCQGGTDPCGDAVECTLDSCDEALDACVNTPTDALCDNGQFCDGAEACDALTGCGAGSPVDCDDQVECTMDACVEGIAACTNTPMDALCDNGQFCDGVEICDAVTGCAAGASPCAPGDSCNEALDLCNACSQDSDCNDGIPCTVDTCDVNTGQCSNVANDALCGDDIFCNGVEVCDALTGCGAGSPVDCDDQVECTMDACDEVLAACTNTPMDALCDNGLFCDGVELCDANAGCLGGESPCAPGQACNDVLDQCGLCSQDADCDDGITCTLDSCDLNSGQCVFSPDNSLCIDQVFCDGEEFCDAQVGCRVGVAVDCDDQIDCTVDSCVEATESCSNQPDDSFCADGVFCNGAEVCTPGAGCEPGVVADCDDSIECTVDACDPVGDACLSTPVDADCDDGEFCNGAETCDAALDCQAGTAVPVDDGVECTDDSCDEVLDAIVNTPNSANCEDGVGCTDDVCSAADGCVFTPNDASCDDGEFCNGAETCDAALDCQPGTPEPVDDGVDCTDDSCDEVLDAIVNTPNDASCEDGVGCTDDVCSAADGCVFTPNDASCDDGEFCNGAETCDAALDCQAGTAVPVDDGVECTDDSCDEVLDAIVNTPNSANCEDGVGCTDDVCSAADGCVFTPNDASCDDGVGCTDDICDSALGCQFTPDDANCDDGLFCDGAETCDPLTDCEAGTAPVLDDGVACTVDSCDELADTIVNAPDDLFCDDNNICTDERCDVAGGCVSTDNVAACDDDNPCTVNDGCSLGACVGTAVLCDPVTEPDVPAGFSVTTDTENDGATADDAIETTLVASQPGTVSIVERFLPSGGFEVEIAAPPATISDPLRITFLIDVSLGLAAGVQVRRDGQPVADCASPGAGVADPDACVELRSIVEGGDVEILVLTSAASLWEFGAVESCVDAVTLDAVPDGTECDDGSLCTAGDVCTAGVCEGQAIDNCCESVVDCDDANPCTADACVADRCENDRIDLDDDGFTTCEGDCDDNDPARSPALVEEICNGVDEDCDEATPDEPAGVCADCVALTLPESVYCRVGGVCSIPVNIHSEGLDVASAAATIGASIPGLACPDTTPSPPPDSVGLSCEPGFVADGAGCTAAGSTCRFAVTDLATPIEAFGNGELATLQVRCNQIGSGVICTEGIGAGTTTGSVAPSCEGSCSAFECTDCLPGDCNRSGDIEAGDPICTLLCIVGQPGPGSDCLCAADCNCTAGLEAADPICSVLRTIDSFAPDPCDDGAALTVEFAADPSEVSTQSDGRTARVATGRERLTRNRRSTRNSVRIVGPASGGVALVRARLETGDDRARIRLARRLREAGFSLHITRDAERVVIAITPPLRVPIESIGRGRMLRVTQAAQSSVLRVRGFDLGGTDGRPVR